MTREKVARFEPNNGQALENIPHMLRWWADEIESGQRQVGLAILILQPHGGPIPGFTVLGTPHNEPPHPLWVAGIFDACRAAMVDTAFEAAGDCP